MVFPLHFMNPISVQTQRMEKTNLTEWFSFVVLALKPKTSSKHMISTVRFSTLACAVLPGLSGGVQQPAVGLRHRVRGLPAVSAAAAHGQPRVADLRDLREVSRQVLPVPGGAASVA